jgi:TATA-binding protein-associated factor
MCRCHLPPRRRSDEGGARAVTTKVLASRRLASAMAVAQDSTEDDRISGGGWPMQLAADRLLLDLLDSNWEVRHGAAIGLRQLLRGHAHCAAVQVPVKEPLSGARCPAQW